MSKANCTGPDPRHAWEGTGLDVIDADQLQPRPDGHTDDTLCTTRKCVWCGVAEAKPYGHGGSKPWRTVTHTQGEQA